MSVSPRQFVTALAAVVLAVGLWGLLWPVSVDGPMGGSLACGDGGLASSVPITYPRVGGVLTYDTSGTLVVVDNLVSHPGPAYEAGPWHADCAAVLGARAVWSWPAAVVGGVVLLGALVVRRQPVSA